jgi:hypothetical protein
MTMSNVLNVIPRLLLSCSFLGMLAVGCDTGAEPQGPSAGAGDQGGQSVVDDPVSQDLTVENTSCGHLDQPCCGAHRAHSFSGLAKRCKTKNTVCPQSESSDVCEVCGLNGQSCCIVNDKPNCRDGSQCLHSVPGGQDQEAGSGVCVAL